MTLRLIFRPAALLVAAFALSACGIVPSSGPTKSQVEERSSDSPRIEGIQIVDLDEHVVQTLLREKKQTDFATIFGNTQATAQTLGAGDLLEISVWEAPPATLFGSAGLQPDAASGMSGSRATVLPAQIVDSDGMIDVPFAGRLRAMGRTVNEFSRDIAQRLKGKANQPQVVVRMVKSANSYATVVGDVTSSTRVELTAGRERLLDALASAGGVRQQVDKTTIQLTRSGTVQSLPLQTIIRDPRQNIALAPRDVVTALFQPYSFNVLGASGKNDEISFEAQGITLSQALARAGGLNDARANPQGIFIFRLEKANALPWKSQPVHMTADGRVPVIYRLDLKDPGSFFVSQEFLMRNQDTMYVSNAPVAELQKFMNLVFSGLYPTLSVINATK
ncbi:polysaccharide export protein [Paraburkholderia sp. A1RI-2L]|uniref:polysaccharide biosynthesis/export family protein n=1 Tax=Paraburkholderia sp. A1RI-2L TaxID=3028367 RepID=UPI003B7CA99B